MEWGPTIYIVGHNRRSNLMDDQTLDYKKMMVRAIEEYESSIAKIIFLCIKEKILKICL